MSPEHIEWHICRLISQLATTKNLPCDVGTLGDLSGLSAVQMVDFTNAGLTGTLPSEWASGFDSLTTLNLPMNNIKGSLPASWSTGYGTLACVHGSQVDYPPAAD